MVRFFMWIFFVIIVAFAATSIFFIQRDGQPKYSVSAKGLEIPQYSVVDVDYVHAFQRSRGLPFAAGAIIDVDNDGVDELFLGGGVRQADGLFIFVDDHFVNIADRAGIVKQGDEPTLGVIVLDVDNNGYQDLIISRESGIWLYQNQDGKFTSVKLGMEFTSQEAPLAVSVTDLNRDGFFDFYVPVIPKESELEWLSNKEKHIAIQSRLYINDGDNTFSDITDSVGLQKISPGALQAIFSDIDDDGFEDLTILQANGVLKTWKNRGELLFERKTHYHSSLKGEYMGMGVGDYDNDGRVDFFLSNKGSTIPAFLPQVVNRKNVVHYSKWILMKNIGFFSFRNEANKARLANYELSRGALFADLNNDGRDDLVVSQNHPYWPPYLIEKFRLPGRVFLQNSTNQFSEATESSGISNNAYSITPLAADFNLDGRPDIVFVNIGGRSRVYLSKSGENNYLRVKIPDSAKSLGAIIKVKTLSGSTIKRSYLVGKELCSDSSHVLFFGLGKDKATDVIVEYLDGNRDQKSGILYNTTILFE